MILAYRATRDGKRTTLALCDRHRDGRKGIGWRLTRIPRAKADGCDDCAAGRSVLQRIIDETPAPAEPKPAPVLNGQRRLFK